jgi:hypothetical protein
MEETEAKELEESGEPVEAEMSRSPVKTKAKKPRKLMVVPEHPLG